MADPGLIELFVRPLHDGSIDYLVTGGIATIVYGEPRFTRDIDVVLAVSPRDAERFLGLWSPDEFYVPPREVFEAESARPLHGHFNLMHIESGLTADCYVAGADPLHEWAFGQVQVFDVEGLPVRVAPVEYVIVRKLSYFAQSGSTRHLEDIARMGRIQGDSIDVEQVERWVGSLRIESAWEAALRLWE